MNKKSQSANIFLAVTVVLAIGVLTGCQYCEPLLMAMLVIGVIYKGINYSPFAGTVHSNQKI